MIILIIEQPTSIVGPDQIIDKLGICPEQQILDNSKNSSREKTS